MNARSLVAWGVFAVSANAVNFGWFNPPKTTADWCSLALNVAALLVWGIAPNKEKP